MNIRLGLLKTTLVDYPGEVAATLFTAGCNLRCPYCHNPELVSGPVPDDFLSYDGVMAFLHKRRTVLGGVCITGGEPSLNEWLPDLVASIHELGLKVKVDTNGLFPDRIRSVAADAFALDIKVAPENYRRVGSRAGHRVVETMDVIRTGGATYEFRTTVLDSLTTEDDIRAIVALMEVGERYTLVAFRPGNTLDPTVSDSPAPDTATLSRYADIAREAGLQVTVRDHRFQ